MRYREYRVIVGANHKVALPRMAPEPSLEQRMRALEADAKRDAKRARAEDEAARLAKKPHLPTDPRT